MNNIDEQFEPIPERVTKRPTASAVARERALAKAGLDINWYREHLEASSNSNGEPCCESCGQPEKKKLPNGRVKELVVDTTNKKLVCAKCSDKQYRQNQRDKVMKRTDRDGADTAAKWWVRNRNKLSEDQKVAREARDTDIILLVDSLKGHMEGLTGPGWSDELDDTIREFCEEVLKHGTLTAQFTFLPDWWKDPNWQKGITGPEAVYFEFGYLDAIAHDVAMSFLHFAEDHLHIKVYAPFDLRKRLQIVLAASEGKKYADPDLVVRCATVGCAGTTTRALHEILPAQWFCRDCAQARQRAGQAFLTATRNAQLDELRITPERQKWMRPFDTKDDIKRRESDIAYGEDGIYL